MGTGYTLVATSGSLSSATSAAFGISATLVDFNGIGPVGQAAPSILAGGVTISFTNLEVSEIGELSNGFITRSGIAANQVLHAERTHFNGQFLTARGFSLAENRPRGFVRTIAFDSDVTHVSLYVADIDFSGGITATAFDRNGSSLLSLSFPGSLGLDARVQLVDFGTVAGIREVTLVGNDPVGIDNLSFISPAERVDIDIKPDTDPNEINPRGTGIIPVAILTTAIADGDAADFDATTVDHTTVTFEGVMETHVNRRTDEARRHEEDVDDDGDTDLVLHFRQGDTALTCDSTEGTLTGETFDGEAIEGADSVRMVGVITAGAPIP